MADSSALLSVPIFSDLSSTQLQKLWDEGREEMFRAGQHIIQEGEQGDTMYVLLEGVVEISQTLVLKVGRHQFGQKDKTLIRLDMRACFGEMSMFEDAERSATVTCVADCDVFVMTRQNFESVAVEDPDMAYEIARKIATTLSGRLRKANQSVLKLTTALSVALSR